MSELSPPRSRWLRALDARVVLGALVFAAHTMAARGVENFYPFSVFPMYAGEAGTAASRIMARTAEGAFVEVTAFDRWQCDALPVLEETACAGVGGIPYVDREREQYIRAHPGTGGQPIELVRRVFSFDDVARPTHCPLVRCTAVPR